MQIVGVPDAHARQRTGGGIVAVIDTGIDPTHPALTGAIVGGYDFTRDTADPSEMLDLTQSTAAILEQSTAAILERDRVSSLNQSTAAILEQSTAAILEGLPPAERPPAAFGHGTMIAGLIHRVAPTARIMPLKAFRGDGSSSVFDLVRAVRYALANGARVISMSFSMSAVIPESMELKKALDEAEARGVICIASAGNEGLRRSSTPRGGRRRSAWVPRRMRMPAARSRTTATRSSSLALPARAWSRPGRLAGSRRPGVRPSRQPSSPAPPQPSWIPPWCRAPPTRSLKRTSSRRPCGPAGDSGKTLAAAGSTSSPQSPCEAPSGTPAPAPQPLPGDDDGDGMRNEDELRFGLNPSADDAGQDSDGDGLGNAAEIAEGTHPRGYWTRYLAEGATSAFFDTRVALANPSLSTTARVLLRFQTSTGATVRHFVEVPAHARRTIDVKRDIAGLAVAEFSAIVESDLPLAVDRTMTWDASAYGSDAERGIGTPPGPMWYLAEGATHSGFDLFYLIQNPGSVAAAVEVTFLRPAPLPPVTWTGTVGPSSRFTLWVNTLPGLEATDVSGIVRTTNGVPILVERSMFLGTSEGAFGAGHEGAAVPAPARRWVLAEGATGPYFDTFVLVANPGDEAAVIDVTFLRPAGEPIVQRHIVGAKSRFNVWLDYADTRLADTAVSTIVEVVSGSAVVVERAMWWPGPQWREAHCSVGAVETSARWIVAEGEAGGPRATETYLLLANTAADPGRARVTLLFEDATTLTREFDLLPSSRTNVAIGAEFPAAADRRFGAVVESLGAAPVPLIVERAMYHDAAGQRWAAGTSALATRLP